MHGWKVVRKPFLPQYNAREGVAEVVGRKGAELDLDGTHLECSRTARARVPNDRGGAAILIFYRTGAFPIAAGLPLSYIGPQLAGSCLCLIHVLFSHDVVYLDVFAHAEALTASPRCRGLVKCFPAPSDRDCQTRAASGCSQPGCGNAPPRLGQGPAAGGWRRLCYYFDGPSKNVPDVIATAILS